jgi:flagellar biosynthesis/type III secretory pathway protein FliH
MSGARDARKGMTKDVQPFFPAEPSPTRPLGAALPGLVMPAVTSPWSPRPVAPTGAGPAGTAAQSPDEVAAIAAIRDEACAQGRAEGLAETAALRERLAAMLAGLSLPADQVVAPAADLVAEVATCVVETWLGHADPTALFAPIVQSWLARSPSQPATARVNPADAAALAAAIGDAAITVTPDPALAPGALEIASPTLELSHDWRTRLDELRTAIAAALTQDHAADPGEPA